MQKPDHVDLEFPITSTAIAGVIFCPKELAGGFSYSTSAGSRNTLTKGFTFDLCNVVRSSQSPKKCENCLNAYRVNSA